jgi:hypothetical protein
MSPRVQVFGRRQRRSNHALRRPASEKRQGTKSRDVGLGLPCRRLSYGELSGERATSSIGSGRREVERLHGVTHGAGRWMRLFGRFAIGPRLIANDALRRVHSPWMLTGSMTPSARAISVGAQQHRP